LVTTGGNVLIGATSNTVGASLTIGGQTGVYPTSILLQPSTSSTGSKRTTIQIDNWQLLSDIAGNGTKDFGIFDINGNAFRFNISTTGNVGIGTNTPAYPLDVNGSVRITGSLYNGTNQYIYSNGASLTTSGYTLLSSGLTLQWGQNNLTQVGGGNQTAGNISFPIAFTNACYSVTASISDPGYGGGTLTVGLGVISFTKTNFQVVTKTVSGQGQNATISMSWIAIGS